jgi:hypothetical protein
VRDLSGLELALKRLVTYLTIWPAPQLARWVQRILSTVRQFSVLAAVAEATILSLARALRTPLHRGQASPLFFFLLYGYQHQDVVFKKVSANVALGLLNSILYRTVGSWVIPYQISHFLAKLEVTISDFHEILCAC